MGCTPAILIGKMMIHQQKVGLGVPGDGVLVVPIIDNKAGWTMLWSGRWSDYYKVVTLTKNIGFRGISWDWTRWFWMILDDFRLFEISSRPFQKLVRQVLVFAWRGGHWAWTGSRAAAGLGEVSHGSCCLGTRALDDMRIQISWERSRKHDPTCRYHQQTCRLKILKNSVTKGFWTANLGLCHVMSA